MRVALILPVRNAGHHLDHFIPALMRQTLQPDEWLVVDSESSDDSVARLRAAGARVVSIPVTDFNHGGTRRWASQQVTADILVLMTQDAILADEHSLQHLVAALNLHPNIGMAYGRQLPRVSADVFESHARQFNYPAVSRTKTLSDIPELGIKTCFCSDSFSAYRASTLLAIGGFPQSVICAEDTFVAGQMLLAGWSVRYEATAEVFHSHSYTLIEEFRRYFDNGVFYGREQWINEHFGNAGGEGLKFVQSEIAELLRSKQFIRFPEMFIRTGLKWLGYQLGLEESYLPKALKQQIGLAKHYWQ